MSASLQRNGSARAQSKSEGADHLRQQQDSPEVEVYIPVGPVAIERSEGHIFIFECGRQENGEVTEMFARELK